MNLKLLAASLEKRSDMVEMEAQVLSTYLPKNRDYKFKIVASRAVLLDKRH